MTVKSLFPGWVATGESFEVQSRHDTYRWAWCEVTATPETLETLRQCARYQMSLASPTPGDILCWWPCKPDEPGNGLNWVLRRRIWIGEDEVPIAVAVWTG